MGALLLLMVDLDFSDKTCGLADEVCAFEAIRTGVGWADGFEGSDLDCSFRDVCSMVNSRILSDGAL